MLSHGNCDRKHDFHQCSLAPRGATGTVVDNKLSILGQLSIPRVDEVLDKLGTGRIFSLFDLVFSFHQTTVQKGTIPHTAFCTPKRHFVWLVMPQGSSAAPGWFVKVISEVIKGLDRAAYLDNVIVFDADPSFHVHNKQQILLRLQKTISSFLFQRIPSTPPMRISSITPSLPPASCRMQERWKR